jgi:glycosyltransferase involved in cell wall biosynthesis
MVSNKFPKITVITPSYNQGEFIEETILSVIQQNYPNLEYIVIDGGSSDNSVSIIKKYDDFITYWQSEPDNGQSSAINLGFKLATGDIICWLNSDDTFLPNSLNHVSFVFKKESFDFYYSDIYLTNYENITLRKIKARKTNFEAQCYGFFAIPQQGAFWTSATLKKVGLLNEENKTCMDGEFFIKLLQIKGLNVFKDSRPIANFRLHNMSLTGSNHNKVQYRIDRDNLIKKYLPKPFLFKKIYYSLFFKYLNI